jgi:hypothetical protein
MMGKIINERFFRQPHTSFSMAFVKASSLIVIFEVYFGDVTKKNFIFFILLDIILQFNVLCRLH